MNNDKGILSENRRQTKKKIKIPGAHKATARIYDGNIIS